MELIHQFSAGSVCELPDFTPSEFYLSGAAQSAVYRDRPHTLNELKNALTAYIRNISQADLQKRLRINLNGLRPV
jgi:hypothetical protein